MRMLASSSSFVARAHDKWQIRKVEWNVIEANRIHSYCALFREYSENRLQQAKNQKKKKPQGTKGSRAREEERTPSGWTTNIQTFWSKYPKCFISMASNDLSLSLSLSISLSIFAISSSIPLSEANSISKLTEVFVWFIWKNPKIQMKKWAKKSFWESIVLAIPFAPFGRWCVFACVAIVSFVGAWCPLLCVAIAAYSAFYSNCAFSMRAIASIRFLVRLVCVVHSHLRFSHFRF